MATLPGDDGIADVPEYVWWELGCAGLPTHADHAAEVTVPDPPSVAGQPGNDRTVWACYRLTAAFRVVLSVQEGTRVGVDPIELDPAARSGIHRVGTPRTLERRAVAREVLGCGTHQLHGHIVARRVQQVSNADVPRSSFRSDRAAEQRLAGAFGSATVPVAEMRRYTQWRNRRYRRMCAR